MDFIKEVILKKIEIRKFSEVLKVTIFLIDQIFHIFFIIFITHKINLEYNAVNEYFLNVFFLEKGLSYYSIKKIFVIIYISFSGAYFVPLLFNVVYEKVNNYSDRLNTILKRGEQDDTHDFIDEVKTGKWIGIFERIIILILIFSNHFSSIGFVIAIKSLARFKLMDNKIFSEYYLLGTLFSFVYTLIAYNLFELII